MRCTDKRLDLVQGGDRNDGNPAFVTRDAAQLQPAHLGQQHVRQNKIRLLLFHQRKSLLAILGLEDGEPFRLQSQRHDLRRIGIIVHNQDTRRHRAAPLQRLRIDPLNLLNLLLASP